MRKLLFTFGLILAGLTVGGGAGYGVTLLFDLSSKPSPAVDEQAPPVFVPSGNILAPLVFPDGRLAGYVKFEVQLEVAGDQAPMVTAKRPLLLNAINMRTWRTPMASGPDGQLADLSRFRQVVVEASAAAFGANVVKRIAITRAEPA